MDLPPEVDFEVLPENMPALEAFFTLDGCAWQYTGMGDLVGLDYSAAKIIWDFAGVVLDKEQFQGVMLFSRTVVNELKKKKDK
ncbi:MAG: DUF1799 domain-containing protein [Methylobacter sp.]|nr:DUF1799 domain-containing protein [Methylobacter sp.]MDP2427958.1 DUF1799 domain-containing protein [Methylobacter sp.]MDP3054218.1 DUF1799 domain-containing protein [Methylobacter sp.]MDP3361133.1 DUF1799 domain-containing protein [Methylobacter sp.]MDZ4218975.1 DUF1799 domain-containing protein [Methylobacter sp.]